ncbi:MAG: hypothetical protein ABF665_00575, partial [Gluconacetobacter sp.]
GPPPAGFARGGGVRRRWCGGGGCRAPGANPRPLSYGAEVLYLMADRIVPNRMIGTVGMRDDCATAGLP